MKYKVGQVFHECSADEGGKVEMEQWVVRSIRKGRVFATLKCSFTWGKRSKKHGDFGWLPNIPTWLRRSWKVTDKPSGCFTTKLAACKAEKKNVKEEWHTDNADMNAYLTRKIDRLIEREKTAIAVESARKEDRKTEPQRRIAEVLEFLTPCRNCKAVPVITHERGKHPFVLRHPQNTCPSRFGMTAYEDTPKDCVKDWNTHNTAKNDL